MKSTALILFGSILGLFACGSDSDVTDHILNNEPSPSNLRKVTIIDPEIQEYYDKFYIELGINPDEIPAEFSDLHSPAVGLCISYPDGKSNILIDRAFWDRSSDSAREQVVFHELGHCLLQLGHNDNSISIDNLVIPESIMNSIAFGNQDYYHKNEYYYYKELLKEYTK